MYKRILDIATLAKKKSLFLFGPRSTGKTTLVHQQFPEERILSLLKSSVLMPLAQNPEHLEEMIRAMPYPELI